MAVVSGTLHSVNSMADLNWDRSQQMAMVLFYMAGTYAQADNGALNNIPQLIQNSRRNGKIVNVTAVAAGLPATKATDNSFMRLKTVALTGSGQTMGATFEVTEADGNTEIANGAMVAQLRPFMLLVSFTESTLDPSP